MDNTHIYKEMIFEKDCHELDIKELISQYGIKDLWYYTDDVYIEKTVKLLAGGLNADAKGELQIELNRIANVKRLLKPYAANIPERLINPTTIEIPAPLNTPLACICFQLATDKGLIKVTPKHLECDEKKETKTFQNPEKKDETLSYTTTTSENYRIVLQKVEWTGPKVLLAYFTNIIYDAAQKYYVGAYPEAAINDFFNVKRISADKSSLNNYKDKKPKNHDIIDDLIKEAFEIKEELEKKEKAAE